MVTKIFFIVVLIVVLSTTQVKSQSARSIKHEVVRYMENCLDSSCDGMDLTLKTASRTVLLDLQKTSDLFADDYFEQIGNQEPLPVLQGRSAAEVPGMNCLYESMNLTVIGAISICGPGVEGTFSTPEGFTLHFDEDMSFQKQ